MNYPSRHLEYGCQEQKVLLTAKSTKSNFSPWIIGYEKRPLYSPFSKENIFIPIITTVPDELHAVRVPLGEVK